MIHACTIQTFVREHDYVQLGTLDFAAEVSNFGNTNKRRHWARDLKAEHPIAVLILLVLTAADIFDVHPE